MRVFVRIREILESQKGLHGKLSKIEEKLGKHDKQILLIFEAIKKMLIEPEKPKKKIGFHAD